MERKRVLITGGTGFLGKAVTRRFSDPRFEAIPVNSKDADLRYRGEIDRLLARTQPHFVIHLAANVGGIGKNLNQPADLFYDNAIMGIQLIDACYRKGVEKLVCVGTVCAYPKHTPVPFREESLWNGYPEETNAPYGIAKKSLLVQSQAYRKQYQFNSIYLLPVNLYGPADNFDLETSHVIPALIRKFHEARMNGASSVSLWGDGSPTREFLYVDDAAEGIYLASLKYDGGQAVNLGVGSEISISELAELIKSETGFEGKIQWDTTKPNGQPRRCLDTSLAQKYFGFQARTSFREGIRATVQWYLESVKSKLKKVG